MTITENRIRIQHLAKTPNVRYDHFTAYLCDFKTGNALIIVTKSKYHRATKQITSSNIEAKNSCKFCERFCLKAATVAVFFHSNSARQFPNHTK